jgi:hypothetical protein
MEAFTPFAMFVLFAAIFASFTTFGFYRMRFTVAVPAQDQTSFVPLLRTSQ